MSAKAGAFAFGFIAEGIKRLRQRRRRKKRLRQLGIEEGKAVLQGKLTYASVAVLLLSWLAQRFDVPVLPNDVEAVVSAIGVVVGTLGGVYGRYRATKA